MEEYIGVHIAATHPASAQGPTRIPYVAQDPSDALLNPSSQIETPGPEMSLIRDSAP